MATETRATLTETGETSPTIEATAHPSRKGFESLDREVAIDRLPLSGQLPAWLQGSLVRTGPARFEVGEQKYRPWFERLAMLHAFAFTDGAVSSRNQFLYSRAYEAAAEEGRI